MKKILLTLILGMFLISCVSAFTFDNVVDYKYDDLTFIVTNIFGLGDELGRATLTSHKTVDEIKEVMVGKNIPVMEYSDISGEMSLGNVIFTDRNTGKEIEKDYYFNKVTYTEREIDVTQLICDLEEKDKRKQECDSIVVGSEIYLHKSIERYNKNYAEEGIILELITEVKEGDYIDAIWIFEGKEVKEHAEWTASMNKDLFYVYEFNESSGNIIEQVEGVINLTGSNVNYGIETDILPNGIKINSTIQGDANNGQISAGFASSNYGNTSNGTFIFWYDQIYANWTIADQTNLLTLEDGWFEDGWDIFIDTSIGIRFVGGDGVVIDTKVDSFEGNRTLMLTFTFDNDADIYKVYFNDSLIASSTTPTNPPRAIVDFISFGSPSRARQGVITDFKFWNRSLSLEEIQTHYNDAIGLEYNPAVISIDSPEDNFKSSSLIVEFNISSVVSGTTINNISLWTNQSGTFQEENITTGLSGTFQEVSFNHNLESDGNFIVNAQVCDSDDVCSFTSNNRTVSIDLTDPVITITSPIAEIYHRSGDNLSLNWTIDETTGTCWYEYQGANTTVTCADLNVSFLVNDFNNKTIMFWANDSAGNEANISSTWTYEIFENSRTLNATSYETATESYIYNLSTDGTISSVNLLYNGTSYVTTESGNLWTTSLIQPLEIIGTKEMNWSINYGSTYVTNASHQYVNNTIFGLCNASLTTPYINFTFKDEASDLNIVASIPTSTFNYYLGDGSVNKTLTFINNTANPSYAFCLTPGDRDLNVDMVIQYKNTTSYPQRTYDPPVQTLSNATTNQTLYLLNNDNGLYVTFQVVNIAEQPISGVAVNATRIIGSENVLVGDGITDSAGAMTFWLNPDFLHTISFLKTGFSSASMSLFPTQSSYTITMGGGEISEIDDFTRGVSISLRPTSQSLFNETTYSFNYTLSSNFWDVNDFGFTLSYGNGTVIGTQSASTNGGTLNINANTYNSQRIVMDYYYIISSNYTNGSTYWLVSVSNDYSIYAAFTYFNTLVDGNIFGVQSDDEGYFAKALISVVFLILVSGGISMRYGLNSEAAVTGIIFGVVLLLNTLNMIPTPASMSFVDLGDASVFIVGLLTFVAIIKEERG